MMAKVIGFDEKVYKKFTCRDCGAIVQYAPNEEKWNGLRDEGTQIFGLDCPNCGKFHRTNP
jgi:transcription initiation factor IIE alpha subunit